VRKSANPTSIHLLSDTIATLRIAVLENFQMGKNEKTGKDVGSIASRGLRDPKSLTPKEIKSLAASGLTQRPNRPASSSKPKGRK